MNWTSHYPWLEEAINIEEANDQGYKALRMVHSQLGRWMRDGEYQRCDELFRSILVEELSTDILLAILTVTLQYHASLSERPKFFQRVKQHFDNKHMATKPLLFGLGQ